MYFTQLKTSPLLYLQLILDIIPMFGTKPISDIALSILYTQLEVLQVLEPSGLNF